MMKLATVYCVEPLYYASSIAVFKLLRLIGKTTISKSDSVDLSIKAILYETGYAQSQWVADKMVTTTIDNGLPATICKMGFVLCDHAKELATRMIS